MLANRWPSNEEDAVANALQQLRPTLFHRVYPQGEGQNNNGQNAQYNE